MDEDLKGEVGISIDLGAEVGRYFADDSRTRGDDPRIVILAGGIATGKTRLRREKYATGYVLVDAADIFIRLSRGRYYDFPDGLEEPMDLIGGVVASRAVAERRNIVTEIAGDNLENAKRFVDSMISAGYQVQLVAVTCPVEQAMEWNVSRSDDNISSCYAEPYNLRWLIGAATREPAGKH